MTKYISLVLFCSLFSVAAFATVDPEDHLGLEKSAICGALLAEVNSIQLPEFNFSGESKIFGDSSQESDDDRDIRVSGHDSGSLRPQNILNELLSLQSRRLGMNYSPLVERGFFADGQALTVYERRLEINSPHSALSVYEHEVEPFLVLDSETGKKLVSSKNLLSLAVERLRSQGSKDNIVLSPNDIAVSPRGKDIAYLAKAGTCNITPLYTTMKQASFTTSHSAETAISAPSASSRTDLWSFQNLTQAILRCIGCTTSKKNAKFRLLLQLEESYPYQRMEREYW